MTSIDDIVSGDFLATLEPGWVWLTGAGPGDPGLMTLSAVHGLKQADVVVYDALVDERILEWVRSDAAVEFAGKRGGKPSPHQRDISLRLIELAREGKRVLRLKGGDPFVFGRGGEEALALVEAGIPFKVIPGITAGVGGTAYAGIPVTHRDVNQSVTFLTGHDQHGLTPSAVDWPAIAKACPVIVMYMAVKHLAEISTRLIDGGRDPGEPVAVISNATLETMKVVETTLAEAARDMDLEGVVPPAIVCVGRVVLLRQALDWIGQSRGEPVRSLDPLGTRRGEEEAS